MYDTLVLIFKLLELLIMKGNKIIVSITFSSRRNVNVLRLFYYIRIFKVELEKKRRKFPSLLRRKLNVKNKNMEEKQGKRKEYVHGEREDDILW